LTGPHVLACDWGTTHLRAWVLDQGAHVLRRSKFALGVSKLARGEAALRFREEVRPAMEAERLPALMCGMIGSTLGWTVVPYVSCPADLSSIAAGMTQVERDPPSWIVPGLLGEGVNGAPDVMRGEETQILGWLAAEPAHGRGRHFVCHPGTHSKWVLVENGAIVRFVTAMTGELYDLLRRHSVLGADSPAVDETSFDEGLVAAGNGNALAARLFTTRARAVTGNAPSSLSSYLSGLLIGADVAGIGSVFDLDPSSPLTLLGDPKLCRLYGRAVGRAGIRSSFFDGEAAVLRGFRELHRKVLHDRV
jgi:2-dehydro-3-deoxygalactonokinase